jgi:hypothetical protein
MKKVDGRSFFYLEYEILFVRIDKFLGVRGCFKDQDHICDYITVAEEKDFDQAYDILCYYISAKLVDVSKRNEDMDRIYQMLKENVV